MKKTIERLTQAFGPSGFEERIRALIRDEIAGLADEVRVTPLGSLVATRRGSGSGKRLMLAAHMDEIGVMVTYVDEKGFLRFTGIGGLFPGYCLGARVVFENGTVGVIDVEGKFDRRSKMPGLEDLYIDVGARSRADCPVRVGDAGGFVGPFVDRGQHLIAKTMDDRIGCAVLIEVMRRLQETPHEVHVVFSSQEETTLSGAQTAAFEIDPDIGIAVDVTGTGDRPESRPVAVELGKGPAVKVQDAWMVAHPRVRELLVAAAEAAGVPYQMEVMEMGTTDAATVQTVRAGVPSGCLSIPCRYIHSPNELVDVGDVEGAVRVLLELLRREV